MKTRLLTLGVAFFLSFGLLAADDFPQWRGVARDGVAHEKGLLKQWPADGPKLAWKTKVPGTGYSSVAVAAGRVYTLVEKDGEEHLVVLSEKDGKTIYTKSIGKVGKNTGPQYPGPRGTPTVDGSRVYVLSSDGDIVCLEAADGKIVWQKNLQKDFQGVMGQWAYSESPLVDGDKVVVTPGGKEAALVALNKNDGAVIWKAVVPKGDKAAYASIVVGEVGGVRQYIQFLNDSLVGVEAKTGKFLWLDTKTSNGIANIPTPIFYKDAVFSTASKTGAGLTSLTASGDTIKADTAYFLKQFASQIGSPVRVGDYVYGTGPKALLCIDWATGNEKWTNASVGAGSLCYADGLLFVRGQESGKVALVEATPEGYKERGSFAQPDRSGKAAWPYPVVANGRLYLRDWDMLLCYDVK